jgi:uncharacterized membrane protein YqjE
LRSLRRAAAAAGSLLLARAEFAAVELTQAGTTAVRWMLTALVVATLVMGALIAIGAAVALALWERFGWYPVALLGLLYALSAWLLARRLLREMRTTPPVFAQTLAELARDREALFGRGPADADPGSES